MTRTGKIARLPRKLRDQLNRRLDDGESGQKLLEWLNALPDVRTILNADFEGKDISDTNLSEWKQGGFLEWEQRETTSQVMRDFLESASDFATDHDGPNLMKHLAVVLSAQLAMISGPLLGEAKTTEERWQRLKQLLKILGQLRSADYREAKLALDREQHEAARTAGKKAPEARAREQATDTERMASMLNEIQRNLRDPGFKMPKTAGPTPPSAPNNGKTPPTPTNSK